MRRDPEQQEQIARRMKNYAAAIDARMVAPDASRVWRRVEAYRKEMALRRALRSLLVMRALGSLYAVAMLVWCMKAYLHTAAGKAVMEMDATMRGGIVLATALLVLTMTAGACFLVREGRRYALPS